ncbi:hypothetical protein MCOR16_006241 [Pyricularia oryzae]|nr:hypothetical protein MCOR15_000186 [Pyricularia oryzae]KAI6526027.1 hypothetical protein MCOR16_006241 [Pyricularia oryzae]
MRFSTSLALLACAELSKAQFGVKYDQYGGSPAVYPSPHTSGAGGWEDALGKAKDFVGKLTPEEKASMVTGTPGPCVGNIAPIPRLNFKGLCLQDGPAAIRQALLASVFPAQLHLAATWDRDLVRKQGELMAQEFKGKGSHVALGPVVGPLGRSAYGGRNWEGYSPDKYLSGVLVEQTVQGIQSAGVQACTKHFIGNEQETQRNPSVVNGVQVEAVSSNMDDRTMHETYLWPWYNAVKAGTASVMCSYQRINGSYACQNSKALNGLLKGELGFQGYVMSDWGAVHTGIASIEAGLDMNMPGSLSFTSVGPASFFGGNVTTALKNNTLPVDRVDDMIERIMAPYFQLKQDQGFPLVDETGPKIPGSFNTGPWPHNYTLGPLVDVRADHGAFIREAGAAGTVLLKNVNKALPLKKPKNIAVIGNDAADFTVGEYTAGLNMTGFSNYDIGTLPIGGGSGTGRFSYVVSPLEAIKARGRDYGALVQYFTDNKFIVAGGLSNMAPQPDVCLVFVKSWAEEGTDRFSLLPEWDSTKVVEMTARRCGNTVVVAHGAAPNVFPWRDNKNVTAIIAAHMPGQETGNAIADVLFGDVNPSGKLPYTIGASVDDYDKNFVNNTELLQSTDPNIWQSDFVEGQLIDYHAFDAHNKTPAYEFGFGLSYTTFSLSGLKTTVSASNAPRTPSADAKVQPGGNVELWDVLATVTATVKNTGDVAGAAVPQLYVSLPADEAGSGTPVRGLRGFDKIKLGAGESKAVEFHLTRRDLSFWDTKAQAWRLPTGSIGVDVGFSSRDLILKGEVKV